MQYHSQSNSFSMLFSMSNGYDDHQGEMYSFASSPSSSVDCTLSLGTPSTRSCNNNNYHENNNNSTNGHHHHEKKRSSLMSNFGWNLLPSSKHTSTPPPVAKSHRNGNNGSGGDPLLARRCANCDTTSTPLWRNGPRGPKSLCNACGIRFKKEERRAAAATSHNGSATHGDTQQMMMNNNYSSWGQPQRTPCYNSYGNEFRFIENEVVVDQRDSDTGINPFMSWRFNVTDRPSLVHDFTR